MMSKTVTLTEPDAIFEESAAETVARGSGFTPMRSSDRPLRQPDDALTLDPTANVRLRIDPSELVIVEAPLLNEAEIAEARGALIGDDVFESDDWPSLHREREFVIAGKTLRLEPAALVVTGIKFGWAIEQAARIARAVETEFPEREGRLEVVLDAPTPVTPEEHLFIGLELQRRGIREFDLLLPWGGRWEPAVDWIGEIDSFEPAIAAHGAIAAQNGWRLSFEHAEQKFSVLPILRERCGDHLHLNVDGLGWIEATRIIARHEPALLRRVLVLAQDRFVFDKPNAELATTEDDIRSLPDVPDAELERVFVEDFRGRQLLRFTASSLLGHEEIGPAIRAAVERNRAVHASLVEAEARRHFAG